MQPEKINITTADGTTVALWHLAPKTEGSEKHLLICHGTFSNKNICLPLAEYMTAHGYHCWLLEWRGHGDSQTPDNPFDLETVALQDYPAALRCLFEQRGVKKLSTLTHSGGGLCLMMCLIKNPGFKSKINSSVLFACQASGAATSRKTYLQIWMSKWIAWVIRYIPGPLNGLGPHNESYHFMRPWFQWNLSGKFIGADGFNYGAHLPKIDYPILSLAGAGDGFIAPVQGCRSFLEAFDKSGNRLQICGKAQGFTENYDHGRIFLSTQAAKEIWPLALEWIKKH